MQWWLLVLAGCGRIGFDATSDALVTSTGASALTVAPCPIGRTAPDPLTVSGFAFRATTGIHQAGVAVAAMTSAAGTPIATATTDLLGNFSLSVPTGGVPIAAYFSLTKTGFLTSVSVPDQPLDHAVSMLAGFMGMQADVDGLYSAGSTAQDTTKGTLFVTVEDCGGTTIAGATIATTPASKIVYSSGILPSGSATATGSSGYAWALNVPVGSVQLTATAPGRTFSPHPVAILASSASFMGTAIRPLP